MPVWIGFRLSDWIEPLVALHWLVSIHFLCFLTSKADQIPIITVQTIPYLLDLTNSLLHDSLNEWIVGLYSISPAGWRASC